MRRGRGVCVWSVCCIGYFSYSHDNAMISPSTAISGPYADPDQYVVSLTPDLDIEIAGIQSTSFEERKMIDPWVPTEHPTLANYIQMKASRSAVPPLDRSSLITLDPSHITSIL